MHPRFEPITNDPRSSLKALSLDMPRFDARWHRHPEVELTWIQEGRGRRFVGNSLEPFDANDLVLVGSNLPHVWSSSEASEKNRATVVQFLPSRLGIDQSGPLEYRAITRLIARARHGLVFHARAITKVADALDSLKQLPPFQRLQTVLKILETLSREKAVQLSSRPGDSEISIDQQDRIGRIYHFITEHFQDALTLENLARRASMSPNAFSRFFKHHTGRTLFGVISQLRLAHAARLLEDTSLRIADVALESGFPTASNFHRAFRQRYRTSPNHLRREASKRAD